MSVSGRIVDTAEALMDAGRPADARRLLADHLAVDPNDATALCSMARSLLMVNETKLALASAQSATTIAPESERAWRLVSLAYCRIPNFHAAKDAAVRAHSLAPDVWQTHMQLVNVDRIFTVVTTETMRTAEQMVKLAPDQADVHFTIGNLYLDRRKLVKAEAAFRTALAINPSHLNAKHNLAVVQVKRGREGAATAGFVEVLAVNPASDVAVSNLRATAFRGLMLIQLLLFACEVLGLQFMGPLFGTKTETDPTFPWFSVRLTIAILSTLLVVACLIYFSHASRRRFKQFIVSLPMIDKFIAFWAASLGLVLLAGIAGPWLPIALAQWLYPVLLLYLIVNFGAVVIRSWIKLLISV